MIDNTNPPAGDSTTRPVMDLLEPGEAGPEQADHENELIAEDTSPDDGVVGPEAAALHIELDR